MNNSTLLPQQPSRSPQQEAAGRVRLDMSRLPSRPKTVLERIRYWYQNSLLRLLLWEGSGSLQRIRWTQKRGGVALPASIDPTLPNQWIYHGSILAAYRADYTLYMQQLEARHPFLSMFDIHLVSRAWRAGLEYGIHIGKLQNSKPQETSTKKDTPCS